MIVCVANPPPYIEVINGDAESAWCSGVDAAVPHGHSIILAAGVHFSYDTRHAGGPLKMLCCDGGKLTFMDRPSWE